MRLHYFNAFYASNAEDGSDMDPSVARKSQMPNMHHMYLTADHRVRIDASSVSPGSAEPDLEELLRAQSSVCCLRLTKSVLRRWTASQVLDKLEPADMADIFLRTCTTSYFGTEVRSLAGRMTPIDVWRLLRCAAWMSHLSLAR